MKRRNTVSVTPAMGASTVAGEIATDPICRDEGTIAGFRNDRVGRTFLSEKAGETRAPLEFDVSQNFFTA